mgnify:CR=1 FL=1
MRPCPCRAAATGETPFTDAVPVQLLERLLRQLDPGRPEPQPPQPPQPPKQQPQQPEAGTHLQDAVAGVARSAAGTEVAGQDGCGRFALLRTLPKTLFETTAIAAGAARQGAAPSSGLAPETVHRTAAYAQTSLPQPTAGGLEGAAGSHEVLPTTAVAQKPHVPQAPYDTAAGASGTAGPPTRPPAPPASAPGNAAAHDAIAVSGGRSGVSPEEFFADAPVVPSLLPGLGLDGALKLLRQQQELERTRGTPMPSPRQAGDGGGAGFEAAAAATTHAAPPMPIHHPKPQSAAPAGPPAAATAHLQQPLVLLRGASAQEQTAPPANTTSAATFSFGGGHLAAGGHRHAAGDVNSGARSESVGGEPFRARLGGGRPIRGGAAATVPAHTSQQDNHGQGDGAEEQSARAQQNRGGAGATASEAGPAFSLAGWQQPSVGQRASCGSASESAPGDSAVAGAGDRGANIGGGAADGAPSAPVQAVAAETRSAGSGGAGASQHQRGTAGSGGVGAAATVSAGTGVHGGEPAAEALRLLLQVLLVAQTDPQQAGQPAQQRQGAPSLDINLLSRGLQQLLQQAIPGGGAGVGTSNGPASGEDGGLWGQAGGGERPGTQQQPGPAAVDAPGSMYQQFQPQQHQPAHAQAWQATGQQQAQYAYAPQPQQQPAAPMPHGAPPYGAGAMRQPDHVHPAAARQQPHGGGPVSQGYATAPPAQHVYDPMQQAYGAPALPPPYAVNGGGSAYAAGCVQYAGHGGMAGGRQQYPHGGYAAMHGEAEVLEADDIVVSGGYSNHHTQHAGQQRQHPAYYSQHGHAVAFMAADHGQLPHTAPDDSVRQGRRPHMVAAAAVLREQFGGGSVRAAASEVISNASAAMGSRAHARQARRIGALAVEDDEAEGSGAYNAIPADARLAAMEGAAAAAAMAAGAPAFSDYPAASTMHPGYNSPTVTVGNSRWTGRSSLNGAATDGGEQWTGHGHAAAGTGAVGQRAQARGGESRDGTAAAGASPGTWRLPPLRGLSFPRAGGTRAEAPAPVQRAANLFKGATAHAEGSSAAAAGGATQSSGPSQQAQPPISAHQQGVKRPLFAEQQRMPPPTGASKPPAALMAAAQASRPAKSALKQPSSIFHPIEAEARPTAPAPPPRQNAVPPRQAAPAHPLQPPTRAEASAQMASGTTKRGASAAAPAASGLAIQPPQRPAAPATSQADDPSQQSSGPAPKRARKVTFDMSGLGHEQHALGSGLEPQPEAGSPKGFVGRHAAPSPLPPSPPPDAHCAPKSSGRVPQPAAPPGAGAVAADRSTRATAQRREHSAPALLPRHGTAAVGGEGSKPGGVAADAGGAGGVLRLFDGDPYLMARERR